MPRPALPVLYLLCACITGLVFTDAAAAAKPVPRWPRVQPTHARFKLDFRGAVQRVDVPIRDATGRQRYHLACRGGSLAAMDDYNVAIEKSGTEVGEWIPPLMCTLALGTVADASTFLLNEDGSAPWYSRGKFDAADLQGTCASYPEYGALRHLRLRGMRITLQASDIHIDAKGELKHISFDVDVANDSTAIFESAAQPGYLHPKDCARVMRGHDKRMCRNSGLDGTSWGLCAPRSGPTGDR